MSKAPKAAISSGPGRSGALLLLLLGVIAGLVVSMTPDIALPLAILLLPGLIYLVVDRSSGWAVARTILLFQAAACVRPISQSWFECAGIDSCMSMLADVAVILRVWLAGAVGWIVSQILPLGLKLLNDMRLQRYRAEVERRRLQVKTEWGLDTTD